MRNLTFRAVLALIFGGLLSVNAADAGVRGLDFEGKFSNNRGETAANLVTFSANGAYAETEYYAPTSEQDPNVYLGTYTELNLGIISFWSATVSDHTPDGVGYHSGICLFSLVSTFHIENADVNVYADGLIFRAGNASARKKAPKASGEATGTGE